MVIDDEEITLSSRENDNIIYPVLRTDSVEPSHPVTVEENSEIPSVSIETQPAQPEVDISPESKTPPVVDKEISEARVDCVTDSVMKENSVKATSAVLHEVGETIHPMFVNCLLDRVRLMEKKISEISASRDLLKIDNQGLKEKIDASDKHLLRLKNHKNKLIRRVLKLQDENERNEEKLRELNAQIALMQFKAPSPSHSSGVNIQVFHAPVNI